MEKTEQSPEAAWQVVKGPKMCVFRGPRKEEEGGQAAVMSKQTSEHLNSALKGCRHSPTVTGRERGAGQAPGRLVMQAGPAGQLKPLPTLITKEQTGAGGG